jgi:outer membrane lipoprotein LolB
LKSCLSNGFLVVAAALLVQACSSAPRVADGDGIPMERYQARAAELSSIPDWALRGRLAVTDGKDGGSGSLRWKETTDGSHMDFHGALGRGAWRLSAGAGGAELELADGNRYRADTVGELVRGQLGWDIPVDALAWWVRGLEAPGTPESRVLGEDGTLEMLRQDGWLVEYGRYREVNGIDLPVKLNARQAERTVKLAIRDWELDRDSE